MGDEEGAPLLAEDVATPPTHLRFMQAESTENTLDLASFLIQRACANSALVNYFYWYPTVLS